MNQDLKTKVTEVRSLQDMQTDHHLVQKCSKWHSSLPPCVQTNPKALTDTFTVGSTSIQIRLCNNSSLKVSLKAKFVLR